MSTTRDFPWIAIPPFPKPGQPYAFVDREHHVAQLYKALVHAGNAVLSGSTGGRIRCVVSGYMGVGKSSAIHALEAYSAALAELDSNRSPDDWLPPASPLN